MTKLKIISLNVNGLNNQIKRRKILLQLKRAGGDVLFLQETHLTKKEHSKLGKGFIYSSSYGSQKRGVAIIIQPHVAFKEESCITDKEGRFVLVIGKIESITVSFLNVYYPPELGPDFMSKIIELLMTKCKGITLMGGDMNLTINPRLDSSNNKPHRADKASSILRGTMSEFGLVDTWRMLNPTKKTYTYYSGRFSTSNRLDYFFMFKKDVELIETCNIGIRDLSDHATVTITLNLNIKEGEKIWRLNNSLLKDKLFVGKINKVLKEYLEINDNGDTNPIILWEGAKAVLRGHIIAYGAFKKRQRQQKQKTLEQQIQILEDKLKTSNELKFKIELKHRYKELDKIRTEEVEKLMAYTKQKYYDGGPNSLKLLAYQLKKQSKKAYITKLKTENGSETLTEKAKIADEFVKYYEKLYNGNIGDMDLEQMKSFLDKLNLKQVAERQNEKLIKDITAVEILQQINQLKMGKTPGDDGYTNEFYKTFKKDLMPLLLRAYNFALHTGTWAATWNSSIITVIHKEGKDATECSSYRPISLLNTDHKIITSIIANRLKDIVPDIINSDQSGFISGRLLSDNIRRTLNIIDYAHKHNTNLLLLMLDAEKAFDRVLWPFMFEIVRSFGFHEKFNEWLQAMYKNPMSRVKVNGTISRRFPIYKGTRQGDPLSAVIFAICMEGLAESIRKNNNIKGITIKEEQHKLALYADDVIIYLTSPEQSLSNLMETITEYSKHSGYKLNESKCEVLTLGEQLKVEIKETYKLKWESKKIKYLGIYLTGDLKTLYTDNYQALENKVRQDLNRWKVIPESILSRIESVKMMILPQFLFLFQTLPISIPNCSFKRWNTMLSNFIWNYKSKRKKLSTLTQTRENGGLNFPDLMTYFHATQIDIIMKWMNDSVKTKWKLIEKQLTLISIGTLPHLNTKEIQKYCGNNACVENTITNWKCIRKMYKCDEKCIYLREMARDPDLLPNKTDNILEEWSRKGLKVYSQMITNNIIDSFETLVDKFNISNNHFFKYLQIRSYLIKQQRDQGQRTHELMDFLSKNINSEKSKISKLYKIMQEIKIKVDNTKEKWENELTTTISEHDWKDACKRIFKTTQSKYWKEFAWKINMKIFLTPKILSKYRPTGSAECWRKCSETEANHVHIFLFCPILKRFWETVKVKITNTFGLKNPLHPINILLGIIPFEIQREGDKYLFTILRIAALKQITRKWLDANPPSSNDWEKTIEEIKEMERITYKMNNREDEFMRNWSKWTS